MNLVLGTLKVLIHWYHIFSFFNIFGINLEFTLPDKMISNNMNHRKMCSSSNLNLKTQREKLNLYFTLYII